MAAELCPNGLQPLQENRLYTVTIPGLGSHTVVAPEDGACCEWAVLIAAQLLTGKSCRAENGVLRVDSRGPIPFASITLTAACPALRSNTAPQRRPHSVRTLNRRIR